MPTAAQWLSFKPLRFFIVTTLLFILSAGAGYAVAQEPAKEDHQALRQKAFAAYDKGDMAAALPLLEKVVEQDPEDPAALERYAFAILVQAGSIADADERRKERMRARAVAERSKALGNDSQLLQIILDVQPDDNSTFSEKKEVEEAMRAGEEAFARAEYDAAIRNYLRAFAVDPTLYEAPLFIGDVYFKQKRHDEAAEWFARAVAIDPDRETAHRYWGDALMHDDRLDEARDRHLEAIIAEPYNRRAWIGLTNWSQRTGVRLTHPRIDSPKITPEEDGKITISIDPTSATRKDGTDAWMTYSLIRSAWKLTSFKKEFPDEKEYRHSLKEEATALRAVVESVQTHVKEGKIEKLHPQLAALLRLEEEGLLEAYILYARPDAGIAQDYAAYRKDQREKLRLYLATYVAPLPSKK